RPCAHSPPRLSTLPLHDALPSLRYSASNTLPSGVIVRVMRGGSGSGSASGAGAGSGSDSGSDGAAASGSGGGAGGAGSSPVHASASARTNGRSRGERRRNDTATSSNGRHRVPERAATIAARPAGGDGAMEIGRAHV